jgi:hypothetical protein
MTTADLDSPFLALGLIRPVAPLPAAIDAARAAPAAAVDFLRRHRTVGLGLARMADLGDDEWQRHAAGAAARRAALDENLATTRDDVAKGAQETGVAVADIKGGAVRPLYADTRERDIGDIDVAVDDVDDAWRLALWLRANGYEYADWELPWLKRDPAAGLLYGQIQLRKGTVEPALRIDIHFGGYSIRHCRRADVRLPGSGYQALSPAANLPCLLGNAAGDFLVRLKDVNDIGLMLESVPDADWEPALRSVRQHGLAGFWNELLDLVARTVALSPAGAETRRRLVLPGARPEHAPLGVPSSRRRTIATTRDAYRWGRASGGVRSGVSAATNAFDYYRRRLALSVRPCRHRDDGALLDNIDTTTCVRLVPGSVVRSLVPDVAPRPLPAGAARPLSGSRVLGRIDDGRHAFVTAGDEVFVPTLLYQLCPAQAVVTGDQD